MRQFIRHPIDVPIELRAEGAPLPPALHGHDISVGGLAVHSREPVAPGAVIEVRIPHLKPAFAVRARVAWCHPGDGGGHEVGLAFLDADDAFHARMVEQVCHIEQYRRAVAREQGRQLSAEEAAHEWIAKYAAGFPGAGGARMQ